MLKVELMNEKNYTIYVSKLAYDKMRAYTEICTMEIGWFGYVKKLDNGGGYLITDVYLLKQEVHSTTTEINPEAELEHFSTMTEEQINTNRLWGHSHVNMAPSPSGQDDNQAKEHLKGVDDFYIRLITNKENKYNITIYDKIANLVVNTDTIITYDPSLIELRQSITKEINEKVKEKKYVYQSTKEEYPKSLPVKVEDKTNDAKDNLFNQALLKNKGKKIIQTKRDISKYNILDIIAKEDYQMSWL